MRTPTIALAAAAALLIASVSHAAPPGTPQVTVGADIKQLIFDWDSVSGAAYYRLMVKGGTAPYKSLIDNIPASTTQAKLTIAAHLLRWPYTRYAVAACNTSGCTRSADISPQSLMLDSIGYFKASNTETDDLFGNSLVLSDDGRTLAVAAPSEDSNAAGVNGNQADNSSPTSGAVYVFRRVTTGWRQVAYLKAGVNQPNQALGMIWGPSPALAINANGSLLAVGASRQDVAGISEAGVVYVFQRSSSGSWSLAATLRSSTPEQFDNFGSSVDMSLDGRTLKVGQFGPDGGEGSSPQFRTHIFIRPGTTWQHSVTLPSFLEGDSCDITRLSSDGNTVVSSCENLVNNAPHLDTFKRSGNTWTRVSSQGLYFGRSINLVLDLDASTMALQERDQRVVGIYQWTGSDWSRERGFSAPPTSTTAGFYGKALALNRTGDLLAISDVFALEDGAGVSLTSMRGSEFRGAVYVWRRDDRDPSTWIMRSVVKSPNPGFRDYFGSSVALCGTGNALAVSAEGEDSKAKGVDGDRTDESAQLSGAAYLY